MFNFSRRPTMMKLLLQVLLFGAALSQHRFGKEKPTGFTKIMENIASQRLTCLPLCGMSATYKNIFTTKYNENTFAYELNKAFKNMSKFIQREKTKKKQKNIRIRTLFQMAI